LIKLFLKEPALRKKEKKLSLVKVSLNPFRKSVYGKRFAKRKVLGGEKEKKMKKMRKAKVITVLALTVVMLATMTGIAAADVFAMGTVVDVDDDPISGADVSATCGGVTLTDSTDSDGNYGVDFTTICSAGDTVTVIATYQGHTGSSSGDIIDHHVVEIADIDVTISVPEFATIAMPVAAILGLVLFFNYRKRKKE
jgi:hypothetical protein